MAAGSLTLVAAASKPAKAPTKYTKWKSVYRKKGTSKQKRTKDTELNTIRMMSNPRLERLTYKAGFSTGTNGINEYSYFNAFRMDSIYDPDYNNNTKNKAVQGYSYLNTLYKYYKVYGFRVKVTIQNMSSTTIRATCGGADSTTWVADYATSKKGSDIASRAGIKSVIIGPTGTTTGMRTMTYRCHPAEVIGETKKSWASDASFGAPFGSNPSNVLGAQPYFVVGVSNVLDSYAAVSAYVSIEITYVVRISDPIESTDQ